MAHDLTLKLSRFLKLNGLIKVFKVEWRISSRLVL